ncbi:MAG TPA: hypothetical protein VKZ98_08635, partial [Aquaticitalea sp.]|nr:hypothetical protein [Aquaticitalea sp.]
MDQPVKIFKFGVSDAEKVASSSNDPHIHHFEEILIGMAGSIEHFIDFDTTTVDAPYICFVSKGKIHRVKPMLKDGKCNVWVIRFNSEFTADIIFQLYSAFHNNANIFWPVDRLTERIPVLTEMMHKELAQANPDFAVVRHLLNAVISIVLSEKQKQHATDISVNQNETFTNFLNILEENFRRPVGVGFYAEKLFMTARNLNL